MRCQRCGFEIEPGQTFCSMCGTEQSKAIRKDKKKIKSILGIIKITSNNHLKMYGNLVLVLGLLFYIIFGLRGDSMRIPYLCVIILLLLYVFFQCMIPYKNPNASKSKKYKLGMRVVFGCIIVIAILLLFVGNRSLLDLARSL